MISGKTALYGVVGHPIGHSRSPAMQNAAFAHAGVDAVYVALPVEPGRLPDALRGAHALGFRGLNVTVPHKQDALAACGTLDPVARAVGAVNTLRRAGEGWEGFNTDAPATLQLLDGAGLVRGGRVLLLGAGGVARAAAWAALAMGCELVVAARRAEAADALCAEALAAAPPGARATSIRWDRASAESGRANAIVNATTIGLPAHGQAELPPLSLTAGVVVVDYVYGDTAFVRAARAAGARLVTGEELLVRQGALAFSLWLGQAAPEAVMSAAVGGKR
ncbi:MAG TPA: shikimate dehydrogenase (NADP+) [Anaeromyxobacteraceae bacterium]|nr:shikimate dehydrogenase (NADP+) [Anaeromyxobacteraceae bacterium]